MLVSAPAGWGKTALLADWLRTDPVHTVWVSLSPIDDSGRGFWAILLAALRACPVVAVGNALHDLVPPDDPAADPDFLAAVADGLHAVARATHRRVGQHAGPERPGRRRRAAVAPARPTAAHPRGAVGQS